MKIQLRLPLPLISIEGNLINRLNCEATVSMIWDGQGESPFYKRILPNGEFRDLDLRIIIPISTKKQIRSHIATGWKISGIAKQITDYGKDLVTIEVSDEGFDISNDKLKYQNVSVQSSPNTAAIKAFIAHLLGAGWTDEGENFVEYRVKHLAALVP